MSFGSNSIARVKSAIAKSRSPLSRLGGERDAFLASHPGSRGQKTFHPSLLGGESHSEPEADSNQSGNGRDLAPRNPRHLFCFRLVLRGAVGNRTSRSLGRGGRPGSLERQQVPLVANGIPHGRHPEFRHGRLHLENDFQGCRRKRPWGDRGEGKRGPLEEGDCPFEECFLTITAT